MKKDTLNIFSKLFFAVLITAAITGFTNHGSKKNENQRIVWNETTHDFKNILMGKDAVFVFTCKNKSNKTMTILKVEPGCSCTISEFTSEPIKHNKKGSVTATYKTKNRQGFFKKFIKVTFADSTSDDLVITGTVVTE